MKPFLRRHLPAYILGVLTAWILWYSSSCPQAQFVSRDDGPLGAASRVRSVKDPLLQRMAAASTSLLNAKGNARNAPAHASSSGGGNFAKYSANAPTIASRLVKFDPDEYLAQNESFFDPKNHVARHKEVTWLTQPDPCPAAGDGPLSLLVAVPSAYEHEELRNVIRNTWASPAYGRPWPGDDTGQPRDLRFHDHRRRHSVKVVFFLGATIYDSDQRQKEVEEALERESGEYGDIARAVLLDRSGRLSLAVLRWADEYCRNVRFLLKADERTFVNLPLLLKVLDLFTSSSSSSPSPPSRFILGRRHSTPKPLSGLEGRWALGRGRYPLKFFPRYLYGHSYVISATAIRDLSIASERMPMVANEDAYLTGILAKMAGVDRYHSWDFARVRNAPDMVGLVEGKLVSQTMFDDLHKFHQMWGLIEGNA